jgi:hypothetical protein
METMSETAPPADLVAVREAARERLLRAIESEERPVLRRHARWLAPVAAVVAGAAIATPALGLHRELVDFLRSDRAPEPVRLQFASLDVGAPPGMESEVIPGETRKVMTVRADGKTRVLWVAPTRKGGFCYLWTEDSGGCAADRAEYERKRVVVGATWAVDGNDGPEAVTRVGGWVLAPSAERLEVEYEDGGRDEVRLIWVSEPIDAGFFYHAVPAEHRRLGRRVVAVLALDADGGVLDRERYVYSRWRWETDAETGAPDVALLAQKRALIRIVTERGVEIILWIAPSKWGSTCYWLTNDGRPGQAAGCPPRDIPLPPKTIGPGTLSGGPGVLLFGPVSPDIASLELRYDDGEVERVDAVEGFVLHEIPSKHYERGHRLRVLVGLDAHGDEVARRRRPGGASEFGVYPCDEPVDLGADVRGCP